jgi:hypothetical protein
MATQRLDGDVEITGALRVSGTYTGPINRSNLLTDSTAIYELPITSFRVHDAMQTNLPGTALADDLGVTSGAYGTDVPTIRSEDLNGDGTAASYARTSFTLPPEYVSGGTITLRIYADTQAGAANVDAQVFQASKTNFQVTGSDLVTTAATAVTTSFGAKDFVINPTSKVAGDTFDIRIAVIGTTSVTANTIVRIPNIEMLLQVKG